VEELVPARHDVMNASPAAVFFSVTICFFSLNASHQEKKKKKSPACPWKILRTHFHGPSGKF